ncbi:MAG: hypothetical protein U0K57_07940 [Lachnospiraceae bacterium]|nr:hypothetical protein [Lachnospiraceae bacterium]
MKLSTFFDTIFVLIWCLIVLLFAMLISKNDVVAPASGYRVNPVAVIIVFGAILFYIIFLVKHSIKDLNQRKENNNGNNH